VGLTADNLILIFMATKKLFSSLTAKQKDEVFQNTIDLVINTIGLSKGLRNEIRKQMDLDKMLHNRKVFADMVKKKYVFTHNGLTFTTNVVEMKKKMKV
jgi:shikimate 5-dehydrogenase